MFVSANLDACLDPSHTPYLLCVCVCAHMHCNCSHIFVGGNFCDCQSDHENCLLYGNIHKFSVCSVTPLLHVMHGYLRARGERRGAKNECEASVILFIFRWDTMDIFMQHDIQELSRVVSMQRLLRSYDFISVYIPPSSVCDRM